MGDPPMEEQGLNSVFDSDSSTWKVIKNSQQSHELAHTPAGQRLFNKPVNIAFTLAYGDM